jgi:CheY-like chemotaxis protein
VSRILVVDDEPDQRFLLRRIFERAGHEVSDATDGAAALRAVRESAPDLVVTDMMMPVMSGVELVRCLRGDPATAMVWRYQERDGTPDYLLCLVAVDPLRRLVP